MNLYFTSFSLFLFVKTISKLVVEHKVKFEIEILNLSVGVHVLHTTQNLVISCCCLAEGDKQMYQEL